MHCGAVTYALLAITQVHNIMQLHFEPMTPEQSTETVTLFLQFQPYCVN